MGSSAKTSSTQTSENLDLHALQGNAIVGTGNSLSVTTTDYGATADALKVADASLKASQNDLSIAGGVIGNSLDVIDAANTHASNLGQAALDLGRRTVDNSVDMFARGLDNAQTAQAGALAFGETALGANSDVLQSALKYGADAITGIESTLSNTVFNLAEQNAKASADFAQTAFGAVSSITAANTASSDTQVLSALKYVAFAVVAAIIGYSLLKKG